MLADAALGFAEHATRSGWAPEQFADDFNTMVISGRRMGDEWGELLETLDYRPGDDLSNRAWGFFDRSGGEANNLTRDATDRFLRYVDEGLDDEAAFKRVVDETIAARWHNVAPEDVPQDAWRDVLRHMTDEFDFDDALDLARPDILQRGTAQRGGSSPYGSNVGSAQVWTFNLHQEVESQLSRGLTARGWKASPQMIQRDTKLLTKIFEDLYPDGATQGEVSHAMELGFDYGVFKMRPHEVSTSIRLQRYLLKHNRLRGSIRPVGLQRYTGGKGPDWKQETAIGELKYDAVGGNLKNSHFHFDEVKRSIQGHLGSHGKADIIVVDLTGLNSQNAGLIRGFINALSDVDYSRIIVLE